MLSFRNLLENNVCSYNILIARYFGNLESFASQFSHSLRFPNLVRQNVFGTMWFWMCLILKCSAGHKIMLITAPATFLVVTILNVMFIDC